MESIIEGNMVLDSDNAREIVLANFETVGTENIPIIQNQEETIDGQVIGYLEVQPSHLSGDHENATIFAQEIEIDGRQIILTPSDNDINELIVVVTNDQKLPPEQAVSHFTQSSIVNSSTLPVLSGEKAHHAFVVGSNHIAAQVNVIGNVISSGNPMGCLTDVSNEYSHPVLITNDSLSETFIDGNVTSWTIAGANLNDKDDEGTEMLFIPNPVLTSDSGFATSLLQSAQEESKNRKLMQLACIAQELQATELEIETSPDSNQDMMCEVNDAPNQGMTCEVNDAPNQGMTCEVNDAPNQDMPCEISDSLSNTVVIFPKHDSSSSDSLMLDISEPQAGIEGGFEQNENMMTCIVTSEKVPNADLQMASPTVSLDYSHSTSYLNSQNRHAPIVQRTVDIIISAQSNDQNEEFAHSFEDQEQKEVIVQSTNTLETTTMKDITLCHPESIIVQHYLPRPAIQPTTNQIPPFSEETTNVSKVSPHPETDNKIGEKDVSSSISNNSSSLNNEIFTLGLSPFEVSESTQSVGVSKECLTTSSNLKVKRKQVELAKVFALSAASDVDSDKKRKHKKISKPPLQTKLNTPVMKNYSRHKIPSLDYNSPYVLKDFKSSLSEERSNSDLAVSNVVSPNNKESSEKSERGDSRNVLDSALQTLEMSTKTIADAELMILTGKHHEACAVSKLSAYEDQNSIDKHLLEDKDYQQHTVDSTPGSLSPSVDDSIVVRPKKTYTRNRKVAPDINTQNIKCYSNKVVELYSCDDLGNVDSNKVVTSDADLEQEKETQETEENVTSDIQSKVSATYKRKKITNGNSSLVKHFKESTTTSQTAVSESEILPLSTKRLPFNIVPVECRPKRNKLKAVSKNLVYEFQSSINDSDDGHRPMSTKLGVCDDRELANNSRKTPGETTVKKIKHPRKYTKIIPNVDAVSSFSDLNHKDDPSKEYDFKDDEIDRNPDDCSLHLKFRQKAQKRHLNSKRAKPSTKPLEHKKNAKQDQSKRIQKSNAEELFIKILKSPRNKRMRLISPKRGRPAHHRYQMNQLHENTDKYDNEKMSEPFSFNEYIPCSPPPEVSDHYNGDCFIEDDIIGPYIKETNLVRVRLQPSPARNVVRHDIKCTHCEFESKRIDNFIWHSKSCWCTDLDQYHHDELIDMDRRQRIRGELISPDIPLPHSLCLKDNSSFSYRIQSSKVSISCNSPLSDDTASDIISLEKFGFGPDDIVWMDWKHIPWPALVQYIYPTEKEAAIAFIHLPSDKKTSVRVSIQKLQTFNNAELNKKLLEKGKTSKHGEAFVKAVQKAEEFTRKKLLGVSLTASQFFGNVCFDKSVGSADSLEGDIMSRVLLEEVINCILDRKIDNHLVGIYEKTVPSDRHHKFFHGNSRQKAELQQQPWFGPVDVVNEQNILYAHFSDLFYKCCKYEDASFILRYIYQVWCPEAIVKAISIVKTISSDEAEFLFKESGFVVALKKHIIMTP